MKREDLRVGGVYKHCKYPLFIACTSLGEHGSLELMALNNYDDIHQGDMCHSWFIPSFEPFDISFSLEQGECKEAIKGGDLNHWRKVSEELPSNEYKNEVMPQTLCLTKSKRYGIKLLAYNHSYDVWDDEYLDDYVCDRDDIEEWKPID